LNDLFFARSQMGMSLAFHIVFAVIGMAMPLLMAVSEGCYLWTKKPVFLELSKRWAAGTTILFAVGAVSGTVLSFELGLLWPKFMQYAGGIIGMPFSLEGFAFFTEAIFLGIYLYGRGRVSERFHLFAGIVVAVSGAASAFFVTLVNAFMNQPAGLTLDSAGHLAGFDPIAAMWSPPWRHQVVHVLLASYQATAFAMIAIHAALLLRDRTRGLHRKALSIALWVGGLAAVAQPISGDASARAIAREQPIKLAGAEAHFTTGPRAPLQLGGFADADRRRVDGAIRVPGGLSFLAYNDIDATVTGLDAFPRADWPPVRELHLAFDAMVGTGTAMAALAVLAAALALRRRALPDAPWFLRLLVASGPLGLVALESGWLVTEWGRQPWIVHGAMRTADAVTSFPYKSAPFWLFTITYLFLAAVVAYLLWRQIASSHAAGAPAPEPGHGV